MDHINVFRKKQVEAQRQTGASTETMIAIQAILLLDSINALREIEGKQPIGNENLASIVTCLIEQVTYQSWAPETWH